MYFYYYKNNYTFLFESKWHGGKAGLKGKQALWIIQTKMIV